MSTDPTPVRIPPLDAVIVAPEDAYRFGEGPLRMKVTRVHGTAPDPEGAQWVSLSGHDVREDGTLALRERQASVRADAFTVET